MWGVSASYVDCLTQRGQGEIIVTPHVFLAEEGQKVPRDFRTRDVATGQFFKVSFGALRETQSDSFSEVLG